MREKLDLDCVEQMYKWAAFLRFEVGNTACTWLHIGSAVSLLNGLDQLSAVWLHMQHSLLALAEVPQCQGLYGYAQAHWFCLAADLCVTNSSQMFWLHHVVAGLATFAGR